MKHREQGLTLVELLIGIAMTGILLTILSTMVFQIHNTTEFSTGRFTSLHELQNAGYRFNLDGQMSVSAAGGPTLTLTLPDAGTITYSLSGTSLQRTSGAATITLARNISSVNYTVAGKLVTMNITSSPPGRMDTSEQGVYEVYLRPVAP